MTNNGQMAEAGYQVRPLSNEVSNRSRSPSSRTLRYRNRNGGNRLMLDPSA
jgi:hypothetical protein